MEKYNVDFDGLVNKLTAPKQIKVADVKDKLEKVAFGVVRYTDENNKTNLWQVEGDYIVAMYDTDPEEKIVTTGSWSIESDKLNKSATIFYKNTPVTNVKFAELKINSTEEINTFKKVLPDRLANNSELVSKMLNSLPKEYKESVIKLYPELA